MPLVFLALDDTLLDRSGAFTLWAKGFLDEITAPQDDLDWLLSVDADGLTSRWDLADAIRDRYRLHIPSIDLLEELHEGPLAYERLDPLVACALRIVLHRRIGNASHLVVAQRHECIGDEARLRRAQAIV